MKNKQLKNIVFITGLTLSFFLGRESKNIWFDETVKSSYSQNGTYNSPELNYSSHFSNNMANNNLTVTATDTVYRCGQSKIYHPTTSHNSFKRCKSRVYKLTVIRAKELGMRHCKCSG